VRALPVVRFGSSEVQGLQLHGDPRRPEPIHARIAFPGGDVDVVRTEAGDYWVHVYVHDERAVLEERAEHAGQLVDARLDSRRGNLPDVGSFSDPDLSHVAFRVARKAVGRD